jgi:transcriptional regulator with XRE-family HTH domain
MDDDGGAAASPENGRSESGALRTFLAERRARIRPEDVGLPARYRRAKSGLSRQDIAELLGVTPLWYALFESGTSRRRFSPAFLERTAEVLEMIPADRATFLRLVAASGNADGDLASGPQRWLGFMAELAEMARKLPMSDDVEEAGQLAFQALGTLLASAEPAFTLLLRKGEELEAVYYAGVERDTPIVGRRIHVADAAGYTEVARRGNRAVIIRDLCSNMGLAQAFRAGGCRYLNESFSHARCVILAPVADGETLNGVLRIDSPFPNAYFAHEAAITEIVGAQLAKVAGSVTEAAITHQSRFRQAKESA